MTRLLLLLGALAAGALVVVHPLLAAVPVLPALVHVLVRRPKLLIYLACVTLVLANSLQAIFRVPALDYLDEAVIAGTVAWLVLRRACRGLPPRTYAGFWWFAAFAVFGLVSALANDVPWDIAAQGGFLALKAVLFAFAVAQVDWTWDDLPRIIRGGAVMLVFVVVCCVANLLLLERWATVLQNWNYIEYRYGLPPLIGPFVHPLMLGNFMAVGAVATVAYRGTVGRGRFSLALMWLCIGCSLMSLRRTAGVGLALGTALVRLRTSRAATVLIGAIACPIVLVLAWNQLGGIAAVTINDYVTEHDRAARSVLTLGAFSVAGEHFPLGAGFSRYGSFLAGKYYSPEYLARGFQAIYGLGTEAGRGDFLTDTQWPAVIGEAGYLGGACFAMGLYRFWRQFGEIRELSHPLAPWLGETGRGWILVLVIASVGVPVFAGSPLLPTLFPLVAVASVLMRQKNAVHEPNGVVARRLAASR